jgi:hypothetical protein
MRRTIAIETSLALLLAFCFAPFEHVHTGPDSDHAHSGEIHAHFFSLHAAVHSTPGVHVEADDDDDHAHAQSLNTFTLVLPDELALGLPSPVAAIEVTPAETIAPIAFVEERAHDPPLLENSNPRAPPL